MTDNSECLLNPQEPHAPGNSQTESESPQERIVITWEAAGENPAVARCCMAYARARKAAIERHRGNHAADDSAREAYRHALPALWGRERIRDFVACVTQGMLMDIFSPQESKRLLYAAQIASSSTERTPIHRSSVTKSF